MALYRSEEQERAIGSLEAYHQRLITFEKQSRHPGVIRSELPIFSGSHREKTYDAPVNPQGAKRTCLTQRIDLYANLRRTPQHLPAINDDSSHQAFPTSRPTTRRRKAAGGLDEQ
jgi:hypothetical protein